jgi:hypothetical protein
MEAIGGERPTTGSLSSIPSFVYLEITIIKE